MSETKVFSQNILFLHKNGHIFMVILVFNQYFDIPKSGISLKRHNYNPQRKKQEKKTLQIFFHSNGKKRKY